MIVALKDFRGEWHLDVGDYIKPRSLTPLTCGSLAEVLAIEPYETWSEDHRRLTYARVYLRLVWTGQEMYWHSTTTEKVGLLDALAAMAGA